MSNLFTVPSGMGGTFTVKLLKERANDRISVVVHMPRNPDWHGYRFTTDISKLTPEGNPRAEQVMRQITRRAENRTHLTRHCQAFAALSNQDQSRLLDQLDRGTDLDVVIGRAYAWQLENEHNTPA